MGAIEALNRRDYATAAERVRVDPALALERADGLSLLTLALYHRAGEVVAAVLAQGVEPDVFEAAALGDAARLEKLVAADRTLLAARNADGTMPLHLAAHFGHLEAVERLLRLGADARAAQGPPLSNTALHAAVAGAAAGVVRALLEAGADANARDGNGYAPLHVAAANGDAASARLLLDAGADANAEGPGKRTPLSLALERKRDETAALLRARGAVG